jgi:hypothetical protein
VTSLAELAPTRYDDPLVRIDWSAVDRDCWWMPPAALSLAGVPEFEALPVRVRQRLSHVEYVHLLEAGLWLESMFIARLASLAHRSGDAERRMRLLHEVREEAGHSLMFVELLRRSGFGVSGDHGIALRLVDRLGRLMPSNCALFWAMVVVGEELPDRLNRKLARGVEDATLSAVVFRIAQIHTRDEAAHAAYARTQVEHATTRAARWRRNLLAPALSIAIDLYARYVYFPSAAVYQRAGLSSHERWRERALASPVRRAQVAEMLRPTLDFLRRNDWPVASRYEK